LFFQRIANGTAAADYRRIRMQENRLVFVFSELKTQSIKKNGPGSGKYKIKRR
jgi:hypothetical protein